jgi:hypothetical protein
MQLDTIDIANFVAQAQLHGPVISSPTNDFCL